MADWVRGVNWLRAMLGAIFPALKAAFDYSNRSPLILVSGLCTPAEIRAAGAARTRIFQRENGAWPAGIEKMTDTALAAADSQSAVLPGETGTAALVKHLAHKVLELDREIKGLDKQVATLFREHPSAVIIESMPGMGPGLGAEFLVTVGGMSTFVTVGRWPRLADWYPSLELRERSAATCTDPKGLAAECDLVAAIADCGECSTWPRSPVSEAADRRGLL